MSDNRWRFQQRTKTELENDATYRSFEEPSAKGFPIEWKTLHALANTTLTQVCVSQSRPLKFCVRLVNKKACLSFGM